MKTRQRKRLHKMIRNDSRKAITEQGVYDSRTLNFIDFCILFGKKDITFCNVYRGKRFYSSRKIKTDFIANTRNTS
ncbi:hypothetical protein DNHGIG_21860 [Collibacillus ludicampi]|uniref:Uncharacterized protein n=1 Tax=Collibacillus ludicampi TaxID=2771369 RepID=A0AAV4LFP8_9BACL|nr:hypothetical protein [Collibacillus ludicampi]GIM46637.1 hypothetical protein DNHGIG_21860 [Collibacillus ludicampi]